MKNSIHVFRLKDKWIVKESLSKSRIAKGTFNRRKEAISFALSYKNKKNEKLTVFVHNINNCMVEQII